MRCSRLSGWKNKNGRLGREISVRRQIMIRKARGMVWSGVQNRQPRYLTKNSVDACALRNVDALVTVGSSRPTPNTGTTTESRGARVLIALDEHHGVNTVVQTPSMLRWACMPHSATRATRASSLRTLTVIVNAVSSGVCCSTTVSSTARITRWSEDGCEGVTHALMITAAARVAGQYFISFLLSRESLIRRPFADLMCELKPRFNLIPPRECILTAVCRSPITQIPLRHVSTLALMVSR